MKILITGIGSSGKTTLRKELTKSLNCLGIDLDYDNLQDDHDKKRCLLVEDVRATTKNVALLNSFDIIIYVLPDLFSHKIFWLKRFWRWYQNGKGAWNRNHGWLGNSKPYDPKNIPLFLPELFYNLRNRSKWVKEDKIILSKLPNLIVFCSSWNGSGISFTLTSY